jgi:acetyl esterase/lipase
MIITASAALVVLGALALTIAISRDGPGVLSAVDRIAGGDGGARHLATLSAGDHEQQNVVFWGPADGGSDLRPIVMFVHGGSWRSGAPGSYDFLARALVARGFVVALAGYRLGPAGRYPMMLEDTARAVALVHREARRFKADPDAIVLAGHSAGAYNAAMIALEHRWLEKEGMSPEVVRAVVGLAGPYDFYPFDSESTVAAFGHAQQPVSTQPIVHVRADAPPMLLIHGLEDTLVKPRNTQALAAASKDVGASVETVFYPEMTHNDPLIALAAPWRGRRDVADRIAAFAHEAASLSVPVQAQTR